MDAGLLEKVRNTQSGKILSQTAGHQCRVIGKSQTILQKEYASILVYRCQDKTYAVSQKE
jgi:hypothetical protein